MENVLLEVETVSEDKSLRYKLIYLAGRKVYGRRRDKTYPKVTQCLLFRNGLLLASEQVVKCDDDEDDMRFAIKLVTKKIITKVDEFGRSKLWNLINKHIKNI